MGFCSSRRNLVNRAQCSMNDEPDAVHLDQQTERHAYSVFSHQAVRNRGQTHGRACNLSTPSWDLGKHSRRDSGPYGEDWVRPCQPETSMTGTNMLFVFFLIKRPARFLSIRSTTPPTIGTGQKFVVWPPTAARMGFSPFPLRMMRGVHQAHRIAVAGNGWTEAKRTRQRWVSEHFPNLPVSTVLFDYAM